MSALRERLRRFVSSWPLPIRAEHTRYVRSRTNHPLSRTEQPTPHYVLFPIWLLRHYRPRLSISDKRFLDDVLWGQCCIYLAFRIKDDLLDHDAKGGSLVLAADLLQLESVRVFSQHFHQRSRFWNFYVKSLESTVQGMARVDSLQRNCEENVEKLLKENARVCAIFTIGSAAVCVRYSGIRDFPHIAAFWDEMAIASQLLDDLVDLDEDWGQKRFNSIARIMVGKKLSALARKGMALTAVKQALAADGIDRIARMALHRIDRAEAALKPIRAKAPYLGLRHFRENINRMRRTVHEESVRLFFSGVYGTGRRSRTTHSS